jgi:N-methylhydantoinase A
VDVGGTFTDLILMDAASGAFVVAKTDSQAERPRDAILGGLQTLLTSEGVAASQVATLIHGTTLGLNTLLQRSGAVTGLLVTSGFRDVLELRRVRLPGAPSFYALRPEPLVKRRHVREVDERILANGRVYRELQPETAVHAARELQAQGVEGLAICFLHAYRNPTHEQQAAEAIRAALPDLYVCASSELWPQQREYERALVTTMNATIGPRLRDHFTLLEADLQPTHVLSTKSNGGVMTAQAAARSPVETLLSGPAAGVIAAAHLGKLTGRQRLIAFDMGGTSADISIVDGGVGFSSESQIGDFPLILPAVDVTSIGAGGGSIAWVDPSGVLKVGPSSAGAQPGPACYGRGGTQPTVTDAYVACGLIAPDEFLGGQVRLSRDLAVHALASLGQHLEMSAEEVASGILRVATAAMYAEFLPLMAQHGVDHRAFGLLAYGGAGPTHAFLLAREVGIRTVVVPPSPGTLCALCCLLADLRADFVRTVYTLLEDASVEPLAAELATLEAQAHAWLAEQGAAHAARDLVRWADLRYRGQSFEVAVQFSGGLQELPRLFHARHQAVYGFNDPEAAIEVINLRVQAVGSVPGSRPERLTPRPSETRRPRQPRRRAIRLDGQTVEATVVDRDVLAPGGSLDGPAIVVQYDTTTFVPPGYRLTVDEWLNLIGEVV